MSVFYKTEGVNAPSSFGRRRLFIITGIVIFFLLGIIGLSTLQSNRKSLNDSGTINSSYKLYSSPWFSINYPKDYQSSVVENSVSNIQFNPPQQPSENAFTITRYGETAKLPKFDDFITSASTTNTTATRSDTIDNKQVLKLENKSTTSQSETYYVFADVYLWKLDFTCIPRTDFCKQIKQIKNTFKENPSIVSFVSTYKPTQKGLM